MSRSDLAEGRGDARFADDAPHGHLGRELLPGCCWSVAVHDQDHECAERDSLDPERMPPDRRRQLSHVRRLQSAVRIRLKVKCMRTRLGAILVVLCSLAAGSARGANRIIGAVTPAGGALLVKHFAVPAGTTIDGITFVSNDLRTVFPKVALLRGSATRLSSAESLIEFTGIQAGQSHHIRLSFPALRFQEATRLYVTITMPASNGVVSYREGDGIPATQLEAPSNCYFASGMDADLGPMDVDYDIQLVFDGQPGKAGGGPVEPEQARPTTFLRAASPNSVSGSRLVQFGLAKAGAADLAVYDVAGRQVRVLAHERLGAGMHVRDWDGRDARGDRVAAGIYLVRLITVDGILTQKLVMTK